MLPFFSIIIPAYNRAPFLEDLLVSIGKQEYKSWEVIVVDDGSKDNTRDVMTRLSANDARIRYIYQDNAERGAARNNGIRNAKGGYVVFIDSDDIMMPGYLRSLHDLIEGYPGYNFYAGRFLISKNGALSKPDIAYLPAGEHTLATVLKGNPFACNFCIRRDNPGLILFNEDRSLATTEDWMFLVQNLQHDKLFLGDFIGLHMVQHDARSMQNNKLIIERRNKATAHLIAEMSLSPGPVRIMQAYTYLFCSVHAYLDYDRKLSLSYLWKFGSLVGYTRIPVSYLIKYLIGKRFISRYLQRN